MGVEVGGGGAREVRVHGPDTNRLLVSLLEQRGRGGVSAPARRSGGQEVQAPGVHGWSMGGVQTQLTQSDVVSARMVVETAALKAELKLRVGAVCYLGAVWPRGKTTQTWS